MVITLLAVSVEIVIHVTIYNVPILLAISTQTLTLALATIDLILTQMDITARILVQAVVI
jgi:hypothetical protein